MMGAVGQRPIVFRFDFGGATGWGHLVRCSALASEFSSRGWTCLAWTDRELAEVPSDVATPFARVVPRAGKSLEPVPDEIRECACLVIDRYGDDDNALPHLRAQLPQTRFLVIDDEAVRTLGVADLIVNSRLGLDRSPYAAEAITLLGERYALLRPGLAAPLELPDPPANRTGVIVTLGGTDPHGQTAEVIEGLADADARGVTPVVIRRRGDPAADAVAAALSRFTASVWLDRVDARTLAGWARVCRFAITACGGTPYELAYLGVPFVGIVVADNQRLLAQEIMRRWELPVLDRAGDLRTSVACAFTQLRTLSDHGIWKERFAAIDGRGASRVADALESALGARR